MLFTMQYCTPVQIEQLANDFVHIYQNRAIGLVLVNQLLVLHGRKKPCEDKKLDFVGGVERETFREIKAYLMSLKHQMFSMPAALTFNAKQNSIGSMVTLLESLIKEKVNLDTWYLSGEVPTCLIISCQMMRKWLDEAHQERKTTQSIITVHFTMRLVGVCVELLLTLNAKLISTNHSTAQIMVLSLVHRLFEFIATGTFNKCNQVLLTN